MITFEENIYKLVQFGIFVTLVHLVQVHTTVEASLGPLQNSMRKAFAKKFRTFHWFLQKGPS